MRDEFDGQIIALSEMIAAVESDIKRYSDGITTDDPFFTSFLANKNITSLDHGVLSTLVDMIHVHEDKRTTIAFKFPNQFERARELIEETKVEATAEAS